jgi:hypothetical protein
VRGWGWSGNFPEILLEKDQRRIQSIPYTDALIVKEQIDTF